MQAKIRTVESSLTVTSIEEFNKCIRELIALGRTFVVTAMEAGNECLVALNRLLAGHGLRVKLDSGWDAAASDYLVAALAGAVVGAGVGASVGLAIGMVGVAAGVLPAVVPAVLSGTAIGAVAGAVAGVCATHWGLRVRVLRLASGLDGLELVLAPE